MRCAKRSTCSHLADPKPGIAQIMQIWFPPFGSDFEIDINQGHALEEDSRYQLWQTTAAICLTPRTRGHQVNLNLG